MSSPNQPPRPRNRVRVGATVAGALAIAVLAVPTAAAGGPSALWAALTGAERQVGAPAPAVSSPDLGALVEPSAVATNDRAPVLRSDYPWGAGSVYRQDLRKAPLDPNSAAMVKNLNHTVTSLYNGVAAFNVWDWNTTYYVADASTPRVDVKFADCQKKGYTPGGLTGQGGQFSQVPVPTDAAAAKGGDAHYSVYSPETDQLWELWQFRKDSSGAWTACWGGRIDKVSQSPGYFTGGFGATASGLSISAGMISLKDAQSLDIQHAIDLAIVDPANWPAWRWPAQRTDGWSKNPDSLPEGARLRLDPSVDVASLKLHPVAAAIARAAQTYGFIVTDKSGAVAVRTQSAAGVEAATGKNPWKDVLGPTASYDVMRGFPWDKLQVIQDGYGKP